MNRRSERLDQYLNKRVEITFFDRDVVTGVLEFGKPYFGLKSGSHSYSIRNIYFRKSHVKSIKELRE